MGRFEETIRWHEERKRFAATQLAAIEGGLRHQEMSEGSAAWVETTEKWREIHQREIAQHQHFIEMYRKQADAE